MDDPISSAIDARQTPQWGQYLKSIGWIPERVDNTLVLIRRMAPLPWSAIKVLHPIGPIPIKKIDAIAKKYRAILTVIEPHTANYNPQDYKRAGYGYSFLRYSHTATIKFNIKQSEEKLFSTFSENARRNIRKAQNNNLHVEAVYLKNEKNNDQFDRFYKLLVNLHKLKDFYIPTYEEYIKKMTAFKKTSILLFAYEKDSTEPIAAVWLAHYENVVSYFQTGITQKGYDLLANYMLVWEGLKLSKSLNLDVFDFETIFDPRYPKDNEKWKGYTTFKKRFHGTVVEYPHSWIKLYNPFLKISYLALSLFMK
ncbi:MAG: GNAT family N-acetyltransferase [Patescibacteria group bacterium]